MQGGSKGDPITPDIWSPFHHYACFFCYPWVDCCFWFFSTLLKLSLLYVNSSSIPASVCSFCCHGLIVALLNLSVSLVTTLTLVVVTTHCAATAVARTTATAIAIASALHDCDFVACCCWLHKSQNNFPSSLQISPSHHCNFRQWNHSHHLCHHQCHLPLPLLLLSIAMAVSITVTCNHCHHCCSHFWCQMIAAYAFPGGVAIAIAIIVAITVITVMSWLASVASFCCSFWVLKEFICVFLIDPFHRFFYVENCRCGDQAIKSFKKGGIGFRIFFYGGLQVGQAMLWILGWYATILSGCSSVPICHNRKSPSIKFVGWPVLQMFSVGLVWSYKCSMMQLK